ncbi:MAG: ATP-dependent sacrificial sulfur transferase LarE [bacterium]
MNLTINYTAELKEAAEGKESFLKRSLQEIEGLVIAYSGGVDSNYLVNVAHRVLGERCLAVTAVSSTYTETERKEAEVSAEAAGIPHRLVASEELDIAGFCDNPADRCYYCKSELFGKLRKIAREQGFQTVADGSTYSDIDDHRPGMKSAAELGVISPLKEAGLTKEEIRYLSKKMGLSTWDKPAAACLASRFPYGTRITRERLEQVELAENFLKKAGLRQFRVRYHGAVARIEISPDEIDGFWKNRQLRREIYDYFSSIGFTFTALDLLGYRSGNMNKQLKK